MSLCCGRTVSRRHVGHRHTYEDLRAVHVPVDMPEMEVHARGEDRKDKGLQTVYVYARQLSVKIRNRSWKRILFEEGVKCSLGAQNVNDSIILASIRTFTHIRKHYWRKDINGRENFQHSNHYR
jgi:hypothetical protein